jgi:hypothetical protein
MSQATQLIEFYSAISLHIARIGQSAGEKRSLREQKSTAHHIGLEK